MHYTSLLFLKKLCNASLVSKKLSWKSKITHPSVNSFYKSEFSCIHSSTQKKMLNEIFAIFFY